MSDESQPITLAAFAEAIKALPLSAVYAKALELHNSMGHLHRSNAELRMYIDESGTGQEVENRELGDYIVENEGVIDAMTERIALLKAEVERRGQQWLDLGDGNDADQSERPVDRHETGGGLSNGTAPTATDAATHAGSGRINSTLISDPSNRASDSQHDSPESEEEGIHL